MKDRITLDLQNAEESAAILKALSSPVRLKILDTLVENGGTNISDLAVKFGLPLSTTAVHVQALQKAGLIFIEEKPGLRGTQKVCAVLAEDLYLGIFNRQREKSRQEMRNLSYSMPIGGYFDCQISKACGLASRKSFIGIEDSIQAFYMPGRIHAQILWFGKGFVEYRFPNYHLHSDKLREIQFSFEACSEAPGYNNDWPSDITVWINGKEVWTFRSAGDFGGKRGLYNPPWWPDDSTQYGELHQLAISDHGCLGDDRKVADLTLLDLKVAEGDFISFRIGVRQDAEYSGGVNLFGEHFGNYKQNIEMVTRFER